MDFLALLSPLQALADTLKTLRDMQVERKLNRFDRVIKPIYDQMVFIHNDYLGMLTQVKQRLETSTDLENVIRALEIDRVKLAGTRASCRDLAWQLMKDDRFKKYESFFKAINMYFHAHDKSTVSTQLLIELKRIQAQLRSSSGKRHGPKYFQKKSESVNEYIAWINRYWKIVNDVYARLLGDSV
jgi:hypothetical protein